jgi:hypothetical protein
MAIQLAGLHGNTVQLPAEAYSAADLTRRVALKSKYEPRQPLPPHEERRGLIDRFARCR